jgi:modulator of FtsH protease HflK
MLKKFFILQCIRPFNMARKIIDEEERTEDSYDKVEKFFLRNVKKTIVGGLLTLAAFVGSCQAVYTIPADSQGVVRTLGAYSRTVEPGIHLKVPFGVEDVDKVPVRKVLKEEFGFRTLQSGIESKFLGEGDVDHADGETLAKFVAANSSKTSDSNANIKVKAANILKSEHSMLTGDLNMIDGEWIVQYQIKDPVAYTFHVREPSETIRDCSLSGMREIIGDGSVDEAITIGRTENESNAKMQLQGLLDKYRTGIQVVTVKLQSVNPPAAVRSSFNEVSRAMQERETQINDARKQYNSVIPQAEGEAELMKKEAAAFAINRINEAQGDANRFLQIEHQYRLFPEITGFRLYLETMGNVLPTLERKTIVEQKGAEGGLLMHFNTQGGNSQ